MSAMKVTVREVSLDNWRDVTRLNLDPSQFDYVADNSYSLAEAAYRTHCVPRAIYLKESVVGFIMYAPLEPFDSPTEYEVFRFMIDRMHQNQGIGREALNLVLKEIKQSPKVEMVWIGYVPTNPVAKDFYGSFGFVEDALDDAGEMKAKITL
ncbi:MAG: GNAT family N-acetyltransferase [Gammaproteobacteria bacterium]|jgi:diamine N-acetyltransferase|nr:GNAT family N-acetyltransferase [Gammaproteobacteria bacterium]